MNEGKKQKQQKKRKKTVLKMKAYEKPSEGRNRAMTDNVRREREEC